jgi:peptide/nickel transport system permease protein
MVSVLRGNLGISTEYEVPVAPLVVVRGARTLLLGAVATSLAWLLALPLGIWMAARAGSGFDRACRVAVTATLAVPEAILALALMMLAARTGFAPGGMLSTRSAGTATWARVADVWRHLALPVVVLAIGLLPVVVRHVRASVVEVLGTPFIVAARARGVPPRRLLFRAALRAAAAPLVALLGLSIANLLSVSLLVEVITGWPGLGPLLVEATRSRDMPVVAAAVLSSCLLLAIGALVADVGVRLVDPRVRASSLRGRG